MSPSGSTVLLTALSLVWSASALTASAAEWQRVAIDNEFRAEGVAAADFNNDGKMDVAVGDYWYAAPDWKRFSIRQPLTQQHQPTDHYDGTKGYSNCFASWAWDINEDGWQDLIVIGYPGDPFYWYENPRGADQPWQQHEIWHSACNETPLFLDITGDSRPELILGSQPERQIGFLELPPADKCKDKWTFTAISEAGEPKENGTFKYYHGLGVGDVNGDSRPDVIIPHGWWEGPANPKAGLWQFHPSTLSEKPNGAVLPGSNIYTLDLDLDGDQDILMTSPHAFGIWWFENPGPTQSNDAFKFHLIDKSFSQAHAVALVDLHNNGTPCLVTGKRYFAHQGSDPGGRDPVVMHWYEIKRTKGQPPEFVRGEIVVGRDTGVGTQFQVLDFNRDGRLDLVLSNKKGVNVLLQTGEAAK